MTQDLHETTKKIKQSLRLSMNGIVSTHQRRQGLNYKINFGVEIPRIKSIAHEYEQSEELATALWQENIRECKLLAIFLLPQEHYPAVADKWVAETPFTEIADHLAMNILCKLPDAASKALKWSAQPHEMLQYCGYITLAHIARKGISLTQEQESLFFQQITTLLASDSNSVTAQCAAKALRCYVEREEERGARLVATAPASRAATLVKSYLQGNEEQ